RTSLSAWARAAASRPPIPPAPSTACFTDSAQERQPALVEKRPDQLAADDHQDNAGHRFQPEQTLDQLRTDDREPEQAQRRQRDTSAQDEDSLRRSNCAGDRRDCE